MSNIYFPVKPNTGDGETTEEDQLILGVTKEKILFEAINRIGGKSKIKKHIFYEKRIITNGHLSLGIGQNEIFFGTIQGIKSDNAIDEYSSTITAEQGQTPNTTTKNIKVNKDLNGFCFNGFATALKVSGNSGSPCTVEVDVFGILIERT